MKLSDGLLTDAAKSEIWTAVATMFDSARFNVFASATLIGAGIGSFLEMIRGPASVLAILGGIAVSYSLYRRNTIAAELDTLTLHQRRREDAEMRAKLLEITKESQ